MSPQPTQQSSCPGTLTVPVLERQGQQGPCLLGTQPSLLGKLQANERLLSSDSKFVFWPPHERVHPCLHRHEPKQTENSGKGWRDCERCLLLLQKTCSQHPCPAAHTCLKYVSRDPILLASVGTCTRVLRLL